MWRMSDYKHVKQKKKGKSSIQKALANDCKLLHGVVVVNGVAIV